MSRCLLPLVLYVAWIILLRIPSGKAAIRAVVSVDDVAVSYSIVDERNQTIFEGGDIAAHIDGQWCVASSRTRSHGSLRTKSTPSIPLTLVRQTTTHGTDPNLGSYTGTSFEWSCQPKKQHENAASSAAKVAIITSFLNFDSGRLILFRLEWPHGANDTLLRGDPTHTASLANFPSFVMSSSNDRNTVVVSPLLPDTLSWQGSFVQSVRGLSKGSAGGPTLFYNATDSSLENVIVASQMGATIGGKNLDNRRYWNTFTAGNNMDWSNTSQAFSFGTSGRIAGIPEGYQQTIMLYQGSRGGITSTLAEWGSIMKNVTVSRNKPKVPDVTQEKIGIQTDNGAFYCFAANTIAPRFSCKRKSTWTRLESTLDIFRTKALVLPVDEEKLLRGASRSGVPMEEMMSLITQWTLATCRKLSEFPCNSIPRTFVQIQRTSHPTKGKIGLRFHPTLICQVVRALRLKRRPRLILKISSHGI